MFAFAADLPTLEAILNIINSVLQGNTVSEVNYQGKQLNAFIKKK
jgi:hypothetical protein